MQYKELYYLLALEEENQISLAAKKLNINQSSFSLYLQRLEERIGTELYDRKRRCLTSAGKLYCNSANKVLSLHNRALEDIKKLSAISTLEFAMDINFGILFQELLEDIILQFNNKHPGILVHQHYLSENQIIDLIQHEKLDLGYCYLADAASTLERHVVASEALCVVHSNAMCGERDLKQLFAEAEYIGMFKNSNIRTAVDMALFGHDIYPVFTIESDSYELTYKLLKNGNYVTVIPAVMRDKFSGLDVTPLEPIFTAKSGFILHPNNSALPHITYFMELIKSRLHELNGLKIED